MQHWWIADAFLALTCWWGSHRLLATRTSAATLIAITLALLGLASTIGAIKFGLQRQTELDSLHYYASRAFGVGGLYLLFMGLLDWTGWLRLHKGLWLAHLGDACLVFALGWWLEQLPNFQLVIALCANVLCLVVAASLWSGGRVVHGKWLAFAAAVFVINGLVIGAGPAPLFGLPIRMDVFHLLLALWVFCITQVVRYPVDAPAQ